jgi:hypothetical protein
LTQAPLTGLAQYLLEDPAVGVDLNHKQRKMPKKIMIYRIMLCHYLKNIKPSIRQDHRIRLTLVKGRVDIYQLT